MDPPASPEYPPDERLNVSIELTNVCNFRCPFCPQAYQKDHPAPGGAPYDRPPGTMSADVFERAVDECRRVAKRVELGFFGEQTLHPDYVDRIVSLSERPFEVELNTNLSFVTDEVMDAWIAAGIDLVRLSLDAVTPEVFDRARPGQVRDLAGRKVTGPDRMAAINAKVERWLARPDHVPTRLVYVKSSHNRVEGEQQRFVDHWRPHLGPDDYVLAKQVLSYGGKVADPLVEAHRCNVWEMRYLMIDWRGEVSPCNLDTNMDLKLGNVMERSIDELYHGPTAARLRELTGCGREITPCRTCVDGNNWSRNETFAASSRS